jgi:iron complex outermembrane receptor protein
MKKTLHIIAALLSISTVAHAQDTTAVDAYRLNEVVVTANRAEVRRHNVPMSLTLVNRDELEQLSESNILPALSALVPGLFVTERGITGFGVGAGGGGNISLHGVGGASGGQILMLVDGQPQFMGIMGHTLPDTYVTSDVERVEIIRGPASLLYGTNAMGGALNVITRRQPADGRSAHAQAMYGSYNTQKYRLNGGIRRARFDAFASLNHDRTDGHRTNADFHITNGYARAGYRLTDHLNLSGDLILSQNRSHDPGETFAPITDHIADVLRGRASLTLDNNHRRSSGAIKLFYNFGNHEINDGYHAGEDPRDFRYRSTDYNLGASLYQTLRLLDGNMITLGLDYMQYGGHAWNRYLSGREADICDTSVYSLGAYAIIQQTLWQRLTLNAGLRYEHNQTFGPEYLPQAGLALRPFQATVLKATIAKGFRSPSLRELYLWAPANPDLQPERMMHYEIAIEQTFLNARLSIEANAYLVEGTNLIQTEGSYPAVKNVNTGVFRNRGGDVSIKWNGIKNLVLQGNYSYLHMDTPLLYAPRQQTYLSVAYRWTRWQLSAGYRWIYEMYRQTGPQPITETFGTLAARLTFRPLPWFDIFVKGENLTARRYAIISGYPMPGATVFCGLSLTLR